MLESLTKSNNLDDEIRDFPTSLFSRSLVYAQRFNSLDSRLAELMSRYGHNQSDFSVTICEEGINSSVDSYLLLEGISEDKGNFYLEKILSIPDFVCNDTFREVNIKSELKSFYSDKELFANAVSFSNFISSFYEGHDVETHKHNLIVGDLSSYLFELLLKYDHKEATDIISKNPLYFELLGPAGILHDSGKLFVPSEILKAPRALSDDEFEKVKMHTVYGYKLLEGLPGLELAQSVAGHHHHGFNGCGYGVDLSTKKRPFASQLVQICDVYEALTSSERPYKEPYSPEKVYNMYFNNEKDSKGGFEGKFDPTIKNILKEEWQSFVSYHKKLRSFYS